MYVIFSKLRKEEEIDVNFVGKKVILKLSFIEC